jgi:uncharacterized protein (DUF1800 family)
MRLRLARFVQFLLALSLACTVPQLLARKDKSSDSGRNEQKRAVHALNRLTFGPRPGDIQQVMAIGVDKWIDLQLHPEKISDTALESRLAPLRTLRMSSREMVEEFPDNQMVRQVMDGKRPMPSDPARRAIYQVQIARILERKEAREERKAEAAPTPTPSAADTAKTGEQIAAAANPAGGAADTAKTQEELAAAAAASPDAMPATPAGGNSTNAMNAESTGTASNSTAANEMSMAPAAEATPPAAAAAPSPPMNDPDARRREERLYADLEVEKLLDLPPDQRYRKVLAMTPDQQVAFADSLRGGKGQDFLAGLDPKQKETLMATNNPEGVVGDELVQAKLLRVIYSERQLEEVMTDFWFNHFNVFINKGADRVLLTSYEQDVIRPRALGQFEDLLVATAKSPAMLFYLDNWMSMGPNSTQALGIPARPGANGPYRYPRRFPGQNPNLKQNSGLNENYGRELLELHTLSVNGGYSQRDVTEVAKVFTGWTIDKPNEGGGFRFDPRRHEPGPKFVLGHRIKPKGEDEGREVLHMLATRPQTAHFISLKLAQRFVADNPPPALVDRMAKTFLKKKGDIREVLTTLFHSPEFWDESAYRAKVKTPLEFVASAVRATGADVEDAMPLARQLNNMGMPLYGAQPPTGYSMKAETWISSSALLSRMNFALALTSGRVRGLKVDAVQLAGGPPAPDPAMALSAMEAKLLAADVSKQTHDSIAAQIAMAPAAQPQKTAAPAPPGPKVQPGQPAQQKPVPTRPPDAGTIAGLLLGSPEFQRR